MGSMQIKYRIQPNAKRNEWYQVTITEQIGNIQTTFVWIINDEYEMG